MYKRALLPFLLVCILLCSYTTLPSRGAVIEVDIQGGGDYQHIQTAIDNANPGDTILVRAGTYTENIAILKPITLLGEDRESTIIDGGGQGDVVNVKVDGVEITGFTIRGSGSGGAGVFMDGASNGLITNCHIDENYFGLKLGSADQNIVRENQITNATNDGIALDKYCNGNIFFHNNLLHNGGNAFDGGIDNQWYNATLNEGNYWDDYAGADADKDGIGDSPYPIEPATESTRDEYPLIRQYRGINIFHLQAVPQIQAPGGDVNISCRITSTAEVDNATVNVTQPNGTYVYDSLRNGGDTTLYHFNRSWTAKGTYTYTVWAHDTNNQTITSQTKKFVIAHKPTASFTVSPSSPTDMDDIIFDGTGSTDTDGSIVNYTWDFGDGTVAYGDIVSHNYTDNGNYTVALTVTDNDGAWDTAAMTLAVANIPPTANFTFTPQAGVVGESIQFTDHSRDAENEIYQWNWSFGDGTTVSGGMAQSNPSYAYHQDGVFNITLTVTDYDFDTGTMTRQIEITDIRSPVISNVTAFPNPQEVHGRVNLSCSITDDVTVDAAAVDINGPGTDRNKSMHRYRDTTTWYHTMNYSTEGNYTYAIWTTDPSGNTNHTEPYSFEIIIPAAPPEIGDVQAEPVQQQYGSTTAISAHVTDNVRVTGAYVNITLPNGSTMNMSMTGCDIDADNNGIYCYNHTFPALGTYTYFIWGVDINGYGNASRGHTFTVVDTTPPQLDNLSVTPQVQQPNETVNVSCIISDNLAVQNVSIRVSRANQTIAYKAMNASSLYHLERNYSQRGQYNVTVHASDTQGNNDTFHGQFAITAFPTANFSYSPEQPTSQDTIMFTDTSNDSDGAITAWHWDFGDGNASAVQHPSHSYATDGMYTVTLTITDSHGATDTASRYIEVENVPPTASFTYTPGAPVALEAVLFNASGSTDSDGAIESYTWDFGDNTTGTGMTPSHTYSDDGTYEVVLTVTDDAGASDSLQHNVTVSNVPPVAGFNYTTIDRAIGVEDNSTDPDGSIVNWTWDFGDGTVQYGQQPPTHSYSQVGSYTVTLTVTDDDGASNTTSARISAGVFLSANFTYGTDPASDIPLHFYDNSSHAATWHWTFGDGSTSNMTNPSHVYPIGNHYNVTLTVANGSENASVSKTVPVDTTIHIVKNADNVVNYVPWLGDNIAASALAGQIGGDVMPEGSVVSRWNTSRGSFDSYVVGVSPSSYDFMIYPYDAIVLRVAASGTFREQAYQLTDRLVQLYKNSNNVVNHMVWSNVSSIRASTLAGQIGGDVMPEGSVVSRWNTSRGSFDSYVVGVSPSSYDFMIYPGDCIVLRVAQSGQYHIEVNQ